MKGPPDKELILAIQGEWAIQLNDPTEEQLLLALATKVNYLIQHDFSLLILLLYRVDVSEQKLKQLLRENQNTDAGILIAYLILERQKQKLETRQQPGRRDDDINEEEKW